MLSNYPWIGFVIVIVLLDIAGVMTFDDEKQEVAEYCANVRDNLWPDYKHIYYTECLK